MLIPQLKIIKTMFPAARCYIEPRNVLSDVNSTFSYGCKRDQEYTIYGFDAFFSKAADSRRVETKAVGLLMDVMLSLSSAMDWTMSNTTDQIRFLKSFS